MRINSHGLLSVWHKRERSHPGRRHGGDLQGMIDHLDYIADLGATAIWSTPLLLDNENGASYHGYSCSDYYRIDPRYGSNELYKKYVEECHKRGLKVIMDIVPNHSSTSHWWYVDQPFKDWTHQWGSYTQSNWTFSTNMDFNASASDLYQMAQAMHFVVGPSLGATITFMGQASTHLPQDVQSFLLII